MELAGGNLARFTFDPTNAVSPVWSLDGTRIAFASNRDGQIDLYQKLSSGAGNDEELLKSDRAKFPNDWSPDGRFIAVHLLSGKTRADIWILPLDGDRQPLPFLETPAGEREARFSPDGRWVNYKSDENGPREVFVQSFPPGRGKWQISRGGGGPPKWRRDGKELFYANGGKLMAADHSRPQLDGGLEKVSLASGTKLGRYEIRSQLGAGGMGEVYLAFDTELDRIVAIKILPEALASNQQRLQRFIQEAKAASALNHPHILTIHEIGTTETSRFIATEFIDGDTLRRRIRDGSLTLNEILDVTMQTASALAAAHEAGIIHRDIKPENIMIRRDGYIKLLDFGLAKLTEPPGSSTDPEAPTKAMVNTGAGTVMGTAYYMSPEQAKGSDVDARTDLWSLGAVLYEMVTGHTPFAGETPTETISLILQREPAPLSRYVNEVPSELERIVSKTLTKNREERYQTARDLLIDLRNLKRKLEVDAEIDRTVPSELRAATSTSAGQGLAATASGAVAPTAPAPASHAASSAEYIFSGIKQHKFALAIAVVMLVVGGAGLGLYLQAPNTEVPIESIAVLPFQNRSTEPDSEYLSDGLAESLIYRLSQLPNLKVSPTSSVFRYKGKEVDPIKVGQELGVSAVLAGRMVQRGDNLTISAELVDVRNNKLLWGEQYERKMSELLATQREIAREIVDKLRLRVSGQEKGLAKHYTESNEAYQLHLKGRFYWNKRTPEGMRKALEYFQQAIEKDPNFALAYSGLADTYNLLGAPVRQEEICRQMRCCQKRRPPPSRRWKSMTLLPNLTFHWPILSVFTTETGRARNANSNELLSLIPTIR